MVEGTRLLSKEELTMQKIRYFIGIDLHKTLMQVCVLDEHGSLVEEFRMRLGNTEPREAAITRLTR